MRIFEQEANNSSPLFGERTFKIDYDLEEEALIVFIKNPIKGTVKTRIAQSVGDEKALRIYRQLLDYNRLLVEACERPALLFFSSFLPSHDWSVRGSYTQQGEDLGKRMQNALDRGLEGFERVVLIGSDCPYLKQSHLEQAWEALKTKDLVLGPAKDGGYYLIGLKKTADSLFEEIDWSTARVLEQSLERVKKLSWSYDLLEPLSDIDYWEDWLAFQSSST